VKSPWRLPRGRLILASGSPRRCALLRAHGVRFRVAAQDVDETWRGERPEALARKLALEKALSAAARHPRSWCLGADTVVALGNEVFGKPGSRAEASRMLRRLSGRWHRVITGVALAGPGFRAARAVTTRVRFRRLTALEIAWYCSLREPYDKAGAYAAQERGAILMAGIDGDFFNVIGLPLGATRELLARAADAASPRRK
jgi:nucleoside triphosphate pyrophosphatase